MKNTEKIKVLIVISNLEFGGAQRQIVELINNIDKEHFELHVCSLSDYIPLANQFVKGTIVHVINKKFKFDFSVVFKLARLIRKQHFDVIHSFLFDAEIASRLAAKFSFSAVRVIGSERNTNYTLKKIQKKAYQLTRDMVDLVVANSQSGALFNALQTGVVSDKYRVVYNGVDTHRFKPADKALAKKLLGVDKGTVLIGMFASFKIQKNHPILIEALELLHTQGANFKLLLVGDMLYGGMHGSDQYCEKLKLQIKNSKLDGNVIYLGNQHRVEDIYPACDFTVLPSLFEGTPNVVLESMACAVPVIATRVSDNEKIIEHGFSGAIVEINSVSDLRKNIQQFIDQPAYRARLSQNARKVMEDSYSSLKLAENMENIYRK